MSAEVTTGPTSQSQRLSTPVTPTVSSSGGQGQGIMPVETTIVLTTTEPLVVPNLATREAMLDRVNRGPQPNNVQTMTVEVATPLSTSQSLPAGEPVTITVTVSN